MTLPDDLLRLARRRAAESDRPLKEVIAEALRTGLLGSARPPSAPRPAFRWKVFRGGQVLPGVNLSSNRDLLDLMEGR